ncbi:MAG TPA: BON domain-containing protein [Candidatus Binataceae bacterium]|nr:BON domain-containing protein [Candidatus Binataceae bacterium]
MSLGAGVLAVLLAGAMGIFTACASTPTSESTGGYIDDSAITAKVKADLAQDPAVSALQVHVITYKGVVELNGFANTPAEITESGLVASKVAGVVSVHNNLVLKQAAAPATSTEKRIE